MDPYIPGKPDFIPDPEWNYILNRDHRQCVERDECHRSGKCIDYCSTKLNIDHFQPRDLGGDNGYSNLRLLCEGPNKGRPVEPILKWSEANYWDTSINVAALRNIQRLAGYDEVLHASLKRGPTEFRNQLLNLVTLLTGATGTGKTISAQAVLFAVNQVVNAAGTGRPRVRHVLWLCSDSGLRKSTQEELQNDAYGYGITSSRPIVRMLDGYSDFCKGPNGADVCVALPQPLWKIDKNGSTRGDRSDDEIRDALKHFDTIIADECDWASDQLRRIFSIATAHLKFSLTASPPVSKMEGVGPDVVRKFASRCVVISKDAVADRKRAIDLDGCLKLIDDEYAGDASPYFVSARHGSYDELSCGLRQTVDNEKVGPEYLVNVGAVIEAVNYYDKLETAMKRVCPTDWYSPHIIVRLPSKTDIDILANTLPAALKEQGLRGEGWSVEKVYGDDGDSLAKKDWSGDWSHPFMLAKNNSQGGRACEKSARILLMCQIGVRGMNNWTIAGTVDCTNITSIPQLIQFNYGRNSRLPNHLSHWLGDDRKQAFVTAKTFVPKALLTERKKSALSSAYDFCANMREVMESEPFLTWLQVIEGMTPDEVIGSIDVAGPPFSAIDRLRALNGLASLPPEQLVCVLPADVDKIVCGINPTATPKWKAAAAKFIDKVLIDKSFRDEELFALKDDDGTVETVVTRLKPTALADYDMGDLIRYVRASPEYFDVRATYIADLESGSASVKHAVALALNKEQQRNYREPPRFRTLQKNNKEAGVLDDVANSLYMELQSAGLITYDNYKYVRTQVNKAAWTVFGIDSAANNGPMDHHAYHVAILGRCLSRIKNIARGALVKDGVLGNLLNLTQLDYQRALV